ncbi:MAG: arylesterase, partial [Micavibrio aeruginosavorus]
MIRGRLFFKSLFLAMILPAVAMAQEPMRIVALGDSLTAGYGLPKGEDFGST